MSKSNQIQLSDHFTTGRLLKFTASPIIMMIFTSIYTIVDGFFVSNCAGKTAFTALNLIYPYLQMLGCLGFMIGTGGSALVAMTLGMGDEKRANRLFSMLAVATVGIGAIFSVIGLALLRPVALLLGATPELLPSCLLYGRILLTFQTAFMLQYLFQSFFIAAEKPKLGLFFTVAAGATNMVLDFVLVGVAGFGLAGAASATVISQMVGGVAPIFYFAKRRPGCRLYFTKPLFSLRELFKACTNGISELMTNISMSLVSALYNMQLLKLFGADGVAAYGVLMYVGFVFAAVFIGYSQGTAPIVSYHFGADNKDELKNLLRKSAGIIAVAGVAMLASSELLAEPLAKIFVGYDAGAAGADDPRHEAVLHQFYPVRLQHLRLGVLHGAEQRHSVSGYLLPAHASVPGRVYPDPAAYHRRGRHLACGGRRRGHGTGMHRSVCCEGEKEVWVSVNKKEGAKASSFLRL